MDAETIHELFREFGPVSVRRMFGGQGIFVDGRMIALVARDVIHLKADAETIPAFEAEGLGAFTYATKNGEHQLTSYWRMPERLYDDAEGLAQWARRAHSVAMRAAAPKEKPKRVDRFAKPPSRSTRKPPRGPSRT
jgi:DNA transformation protein and related proteins